MQNQTSITNFDPHIIPWQYDAIKQVRQFDYSQGMLHLLLSGALGSSKSQLAAHIVHTHCLFNPGARVLVLRRALKDLKRTIWKVLLGQLEGHQHFIHRIYAHPLTIIFKNGSEIIGDSYDNYDLEKFRSLELSGVLIEEASENERKDLYDAVVSRVGRAIGIKENFVIQVTNPDSTTHWIYDHFIAKEHPSRRVIYSLTEQNPFLPHWYIESIRNQFDEQMTQRMLYGKWIDVGGVGVYYNYDSKIHYKNEEYEPLLDTYIHICFDFNIGMGKPFSVVCYQRVGFHYHVFKEFVLDTRNGTMDMMEEVAASGLLDNYSHFMIKGDATGEARTTKSIHSDYDLIKKFLNNYREGIIYRMLVPRANPPIKERHNRINQILRDGNGNTRITVYNCPTVDKALRLTCLVKGGQYVEDDSPRHPYQHIGTALGYGIVYDERLEPYDPNKLRNY